MSATVMATPVAGDDEAPCVGAVCDGCQAVLIYFDSVAFGSDHLARVIAEHDCEAGK